MTQEIRHVFVMAGADPNTHWLDECLALDAKGFIKTGPDLSAMIWSPPGGRLRAHHIYSRQSAGCLRRRRRARRQLKRVASAVGEGAIAVAFVHRVLQE